MEDEILLKFKQIYDKAVKTSSFKDSYEIFEYLIRAYDEGRDKFIVSDNTIILRHIFLIFTDPEQLCASWKQREVRAEKGSDTLWSHKNWNFAIIKKNINRAFLSFQIFRYL